MLLIKWVRTLGGAIPRAPSAAIKKCLLLNFSLLLRSFIPDFGNSSIRSFSLPHRQESAAGQRQPTQAWGECSQQRSQGRNGQPRPLGEGKKKQRPLLPHAAPGRSACCRRGFSRYTEVPPRSLQGRAWPGATGQASGDAPERRAAARGRGRLGGSSGELGRCPVSLPGRGGPLVTWHKHWKLNINMRWFLLTIEL